MAKFDPEVVLEFYANAWPTEEGVRDMRSWVRGQWIPFDADALSQHDHLDPDVDDTAAQQCLA